MTTNETTPATRRERRAARRAAASKVLTPAFRRWAYGFSGAAVAFAAAVGWLPAVAATAAAPLLVALFFVDEQGEPR